MLPDYYAILGVPYSATASEIRQAYRRRAREHHPDVGGRAEDFRALQEAYDVLGDTSRRRAYDRMRTARHRSIRVRVASSEASAPRAEPLIPVGDTEPLIRGMWRPRAWRHEASNAQRTSLADEVIRLLNDFF